MVPGAAIRGGVNARTLSSTTTRAICSSRSTSFSTLTGSSIRTTLSSPSARSKPSNNLLPQRPPKSAVPARLALRQFSNTHVSWKDEPSPDQKNEKDDDQPPKGPLPDLRQGIPSTFEQEFSDKSSSFKEKDAEDSSLNLTEDPARPDNDGRELPKEAYVSSIERRRMRFANFAYAGALAAGVVSFVWLGWDWESEEEARMHPDVPYGWTPSAMYGRASARLSKTLGYYTEPAFPKLLPDVDPELKPPHTLVLSLEDLLVTSRWSRQNGWEVAKRPGFDYFIRYLSSYYELVIFTTVPSFSGEMVYRKLDPYRLIMFPLFREATRYMKGEHVKDLSCLNRDLSKTIIIDTNPAHVQLQPENAIVLPKWNGQPKDEHAGDLVALIPFLEYAASLSNEDLRKVLKSYEGTHIPTEFAKREARVREKFNEQRRGGKPSKKAGGVGGLSNMLGFSQGPLPGQLVGEPSFAEDLAQGRTLSDRVRERGRRQYEELDRQIRENGEKWLDEQAKEEKRMMDEAAKTVQNNPLAYFSMIFGGGRPGDANTSGSGSGSEKP